MSSKPPLRASACCGTPSPEHEDFASTDSLVDHVYRRTGSRGHLARPAVESRDPQPLASSNINTGPDSQRRTSHLVRVYIRGNGPLDCSICIRGRACTTPHGGRTTKAVGTLSVGQPSAANASATNSRRARCRGARSGSSRRHWLEDRLDSRAIPILLPCHRNGGGGCINARTSTRGTRNGSATPPAGGD